MKRPTKRPAVSNDLVHLRHRGWAPTALRLSPLQFRVLRMISRGWLLGREYKTQRTFLMHYGRSDIRVHLATFNSLARRELIGPAHSKIYGLVYTTTILATAALEVYDL